MKSFITAVTAGALFYAGSVLAAVNVNTADANTLAQLSGIGPAKAQAIIKDRTKNGDYTMLDQLTRVRGIGEKTVEGLQSEATVGKRENKSSN